MGWPYRHALQWIWAMFMPVGWSWASLHVPNWIVLAGTKRKGSMVSGSFSACRTQQFLYIMSLWSDHLATDLTQLKPHAVQPTWVRPDSKWAGTWLMLNKGSIKRPTTAIIITTIFKKMPQHRQQNSETWLWTHCQWSISLSMKISDVNSASGFSFKDVKQGYTTLLSWYAMLTQHILGVGTWGHFLNYGPKKTSATKVFWGGLWRGQACLSTTHLVNGLKIQDRAWKSLPNLHAVGV